MNTNCFKKFHQNFHGDTYSACAECQGKCEEFKLAPLFSGEKTYMSEYLNLNIKQLETSYLSNINTPYGEIDVLNIHGACKFLDEEYNCTADKAKPILCETYPIIFSVVEDEVVFSLDGEFCPMVLNPKYKKIINNFETKGIAQLRLINEDIEWWKLASLLDEYDYDYNKLNLYIPKKSQYFLEHLYNFTCNGYEEESRNKGIQFLKLRNKKLLQKVNELANRSKLSNKILSNITDIKDNINHWNDRIKLIQGAPLFNEYNKIISEFFYDYTINKKLIQRTEFEFNNLERISDNNLSLKSKIIIHDNLDVKNNDSIIIAKTIEYMCNNFSSLVIEEYSIILERFVKEDNSASEIRSIPVMISYIDESSQIKAALMGEIYTNLNTSCSYLSHIFVSPEYRKLGLARKLEAAFEQYAQDYSVKQGIKMIQFAEIEFEKYNSKGFGSRLEYHRKMKREIVYPLNYAQPDILCSSSKSICQPIPMILSIKNHENYSNDEIYSAYTLYMNCTTTGQIHTYKLGRLINSSIQIKRINKSELLFSNISKNYFLLFNTLMTV